MPNGFFKAVFLQKFEWLVSFASLFAAPGFHHNRLRVKSLELLLVLSPELDVFFDVKVGLILPKI